MNHQILVVDNEPYIVEELIEFLMGHGHDCIGAASPGEALAQFQGNPAVNVVLSDFQMQEMNGVQLVAALRAADSARVFEAAIFTGDAEKDDVIAALRVGVADYFQKPLDLDQLLASLDKILAKLEQRNAKTRMKNLNQDFRMLMDSFNKLYGDMGASSQESRSAAKNTPASARRAVTDLSEKLSPRQQDVAALIARGLTNYQIACELGISENTVKIYVSQVLRIFNLNNRTQLAIILEGGKEQSTSQAAM